MPVIARKTGDVSMPDMPDMDRAYLSMSGVFLFHPLVQAPGHFSRGLRWGGVLLKRQRDIDDAVNGLSIGDSYEVALEILQVTPVKWFCQALWKYGLSYALPSLCMAQLGQ